MCSVNEPSAAVGQKELAAALPPGKDDVAEAGGKESVGCCAHDEDGRVRRSRHVLRQRDGDAEEVGKVADGDGATVNAANEFFRAIQLSTPKLR
jgi:hypothetical protein